MARTGFSAQTLAVLAALLDGVRLDGATPEGAVPDGDWHHGYDLARRTGLKSGTLYPILMRMEARGLLEASWEHTEPGRPPRHMYRLTPSGLQHARQHVRSGRAARAPRPALGASRS